METILDLIVLASFICFVLGLMRPSMVKMKSRKMSSVIFGGIFIFFFVVLCIIVSPSIPTNAGDNQQAANVAASPDDTTPDELPLYLTVYAVQSANTAGLSASDQEELGQTPPLSIVDERNEDTGYFENLSTATGTTLTDTQVTAMLAALQTLRKQHPDKWFQVTIFDDPAIAENDGSDYSNLSNAEYCSEIFSHYRGIYTWNPTNQHEDMSLGENCEWQSLIRQ